MIKQYQVMKMIEAKGVGISKIMFVVGLFIAILASILISVVVVTQLPLAEGSRGDKCDKGDTGATGAMDATYVINTDGLNFPHKHLKQA